MGILPMRSIIIYEEELCIFCHLCFKNARTEDERKWVRLEKPSSYEHSLSHLVYYENPHV